MNTYQVNVCFSEQADSYDEAVTKALDKLSEPMAKLDIAVMNEADGKVRTMGAIFSVLSAGSKMDAEALAEKLRQSVGDKLVREPHISASGGEKIDALQAQAERLNELLHGIMEACQEPLSAAQLREKVLSVVGRVRGH